MEKIYMEENKGKKQTRSVVDFSVVLSFVVAIFAVFSLATFGIVSNQSSGISYAAPTARTAIGNSFTLAIPTEDGSSFTKDLYSYVEIDGTKTYYNFPMYYANSVAIENQIFCVERGEDVNNGSTYNATSEDIRDPGLVYLLSFVDADVTTYDDMIDGWVIQSAIWLYLYEKEPTNAKYALRKKAGNESNPPQDDHAVLTSGGPITISFGRGGTENTYSDLLSKVRELVNAAKSATIPRVSVTKENDDISKTTDGKYYQTSLITVATTSSSSFTSFDISLSGFDGAIAVDENGNELASLTNVAPGTKFYVRVPADKVSETVNTESISIKAYFSVMGGKYYSSTDSPQRMVTFAPGYVSGGTSFELVGTPDTGMNTAQTIYFIGLIVLLCGVGIVYANAKPVENKQ